MRGDPQTPRTCASCGAHQAETIHVPGFPDTCGACLIAGRFFATAPALRLVEVALQLLDCSSSVQAVLTTSLEDLESVVRRRDYDEARGRFLALAEAFLEQDCPLLTAILMYRALHLPGTSAAVHEMLGRAAEHMKCTRDAIQHYKTAGWLALKTGSGGLLERSLQAVERLAPGDPWPAKTRRQLGVAPVES